MMVNLYMDIYDPEMHPLLKEMPMYATSVPQQKMASGVKRFKITVDVPSDEALWFGKIEGVLPVEGMKEVDKQQQQQPIEISNTRKKKVRND